MVLTFSKRAVSPLHFEPLSPLPEDILCPGSSDEEDDLGHRDKRRRIEAVGNKCLEGWPPFILSAGLRGPFDKNWKNPWARRRRQHRRNVSSIPSHGEVSKTSSKRALETARSLESPNPGKLRLAGKSVEEQDGRRSLSPVQDTRLVREPATSYGGQYHASRLRSPIDESKIHPPNNDLRYRTDKSYYDNNRDRSAPAAPTGSTDTELWLRSDAGYLRRVQRVQQRSPTPTPAAKTRIRSPLKNSLPATSRRMSPPSRVPQKEKPPVPTSNLAAHTGFTPVNRSIPKRLNVESESRSSPCLKMKVPNIQPKRISSEDSCNSDSRTIRETSLAKADIVTQQGFLEAKRLSQEAAEQAKLDKDNLELDTSIQQISPHSLRATAAALVDVNPTTKFSRDFIPSEVCKANAPGQVSKIPTRSPHVLPPSSHLPGFRYRFAGRRPNSSSSNSSAVVEELQDVRVNSLSKARTKVTRRLSFTPNGTVKGRETTKSSGNASASSRSYSQLSLPRAEGITDDQSPDEAHTGANPSQQLVASLQATVNKSTTSGELPEAQIVPNQPGRMPQEPSGPSTNILETDRQSPIKFPSMEEGVADSQWCTQAAILKAERSFQESILTPIQRLGRSSPSQTRLMAQANYKPAAARTVKPSRTPLFPRPQAIGMISNDPSPAISIYKGPPMSTQEMIDAVSPFPLTTVKKPRLKHRASFGPPPRFYKGAASNGSSFKFSNPKDLDMSTSPEVEVHFADCDERSALLKSSPPTPILPLRNARAGTSSGAPATTYRAPTLKNDPSTIPSVTHPTPTASVMSFSIAPNGTLTEVFQQDGQGFENDWDLEAAIEDAGSFLGTWDVDKEAKKMTSGSTGGPK